MTDEEEKCPFCQVEPVETFCARCGTWQCGDCDAFGDTCCEEGEA